MEGENAAGPATQAPVGMSEKLVSREKYWEEASYEQKIERLRDELARACKTIQEQSRIIVSLGTHLHGADGKLLVPMAESLHIDRSLGIFAHDSGIPHGIRRPHERR